MSVRAHSYHEPDIVTILVQSSFLLLLNVVGYTLDRTIYCGLIGQILIGVAYGTPGAQILSVEFETITTNLGYIGLILLVYEGGLSTSIGMLRANIYLSLLIAATGVIFPIAFSFSLLALLHATPTQAFAAGCALCSTSLGTTFSVLKTTGLTTSRLGAVLTSAAMLDDVIGLVMIRVISSLGQGSSPFRATTIIRPVFVSIAYAICIPLICGFLVRPVMLLLAPKDRSESSRMHRFVRESNITFLMSMLLLLGMVAGATYAGTSGLFASYIVGASISWIEEQRAEESDKTTERTLTEIRSTSNHTSSVSCTTFPTTNGSPKPEEAEPPSLKSDSGERRGQQMIEVDCSVETERNITQEVKSRPPVKERLSSLKLYDEYLVIVVERVLKPMFFASIGYAIPIAQMFGRQIFWRGLVYAMLMTIGKLFCGVWLIRSAFKERPASAPEKPEKLARKSPRAKSIYPACLLGSAMVARGEIGFLISAVAQTSGVFGSTGRDDSSDIFMVVTWAILLCTIVGPITVGIMAKRIRKLQSEERANAAGKVDPLGSWG